MRLHRADVAAYELAGQPNTYRDAPTGDPCRLPVGVFVEDQAWRAEAACRGRPLGLFFPRRGDIGIAAKAICASCPVAEACLSAALAEESHSGPAGVRGGLTARERARLRRDHRAGV